MQQLIELANRQDASNSKTSSAIGMAQQSSEGLNSPTWNSIVSAIVNNKEISKKLIGDTDLKTYLSNMASGSTFSGIDQQANALAEKNNTLSDSIITDAKNYDELLKSAEKVETSSPVVAVGSVIGSGTLGYPLKTRVPVTSQYLVDRGDHKHAGIDLGAYEGSPIIAADGGTVEFAGWNNGYGQQVRINHGNGLVTSYSHMSRICMLTIYQYFEM